MLRFNTILHPTDFSEHSNYAFQLACSMARDHEARLVIMHVVATTGPEFVPAGVAEDELQPQGFRRKLWDELRAVAPPDSTLPFEHILAVGEPAPEILRHAREAKCDLIVLGTHGRTGLDRLLMGSVAEEIVRKAPCPVLTIRKPTAIHDK